MAFDGVFIKALCRELDQKLTGSRLFKIQETDRDELFLTFKTEDNRLLRVFLSANASLPLLYLTDEQKESPSAAPNFCMVLRKHLQNGKLLSVSSPGFERIVEFLFEHYNEMGDLCRLRLIMEIMGKHSNILLVNQDEVILDAIRHVSPQVSSVRTVLPGKPYFVPNVQSKADASTESFDGFLTALRPEDRELDAIVTRYAGFSENTVSELFFENRIDGDAKILSLSDAEKKKLAEVFISFRDKVLSGSFTFEIAFEHAMPVQFSSTGLASYKARPDHYEIGSFESPSALLEAYYGKRAREVKMREKSAELRKTVKTLLERSVKKLDLQNARLKDTESRERNKLFGELLSAFSYSLPSGERTVTVQNYHDENRPVSIPVDPDLSIAENAKRYYDRYAREKRTYEALSIQKAETERELFELRSLFVSLDLAESVEDLSGIRDELEKSGFVKKKAKSTHKKQTLKSAPYHYRSRDGFDIFVGKNNIQNEELTFKTANGNDYFFHAKKTPGSHVILKTEGKEVPDQTFEDAAALAAYYSSARENALVEVDYVRRKAVKKVPGQRPGFVIYDTNYSMMAPPEIDGLIRIK